MKSELEEQGQKTGSIDRNVEDTKINVIKAEFEIEQANKDSKDLSRSPKCLLYCTGSILVLILLVLLFCFIL